MISSTTALSAWSPSPEFHEETLPIPWHSRTPNQQSFRRIPRTYASTHSPLASVFLSHQPLPQSCVPILLQHHHQNSFPPSSFQPLFYSVLRIGQPSALWLVGPAFDFLQELSLKISYSSSSPCHEHLSGWSGSPEGFKSDHLERRGASLEWVKQRDKELFVEGSCSYGSFKI